MARPKNDGRGRLGGRKAGTPNKTTTTTKQWIQAFLEANYDKFRDDFTKLPPKDSVTAFLSLLPYVVPKQMATAATVAIERLTDEQISDVAGQVLNSMNDEDTTE